MSILIEGMEMPKAEFGSMIVAIRPDGMVEDVMGCYVGKVVPVPPHGRLIEKNAVFELIQSVPSVDKLLPVEFMKALYKIPTVIEAEEEICTKN